MLFYRLWQEVGARGKGPYLLFLTDDPALRERAEQTLTGESKKIRVRMLFSARSGEKPFNPAYHEMVIKGEELNHLHIAGRVVETKAKW